CAQRGPRRRVHRSARDHGGARSGDARLRAVGHDPEGPAMTGAMIRLPLAVVEGVHLAGLVEEFTDVLSSFGDDPDPGLTRLTPDAYPDDSAASADFTAATRD